jgi:hypothetical protein
MIMDSFYKGRDRRRDDDKRNALAAYAQDPNEANLNSLAPHDPQFVIQQRQQMQKSQAEAEERQLLGAALNGDPAARQRLAYVNSDAYIKLDDRMKEAVDEGMNVIAQQAFSILQLPEEQRAAALQQALANLKAQGMDVDAFRLSGNATQDLKAALAMAGKLEAWEKFAQPNYTPVGEGGLAGFQFGQPIQQGGQAQNFAPSSGQLPRPQSAAERDALPPGSRYIAPDGSIKIKGGAGSNASGGFRP